MPIVAEYAQSNFSSCKSCSKEIAVKSLRLGLITKGPGGIDRTRWHHFDCFPESIASVDDIQDDHDALMKLVEQCGEEHLTEIVNGEQDSLKELVQRRGKKTLKMDEANDESGTGNRLAEETNKREHSQVGEMVEDDELQTNMNQLTTMKPKMNIGETTSLVEVEAKISLSASAVKDKYRDARLLPKWKAFETVIFLERDDGLNDSERIAAFDYDGCLAKTSVKIVGADAWSLMYPIIPEKLQSLYSQGYKLMNATLIGGRTEDLWTPIGRLNSFIKTVEVPVQVFIACGVARSCGKDDLYRKPKLGMWQLMKKHFNSGIAIDMDKSFYVGDAAGRKGDHSDADINLHRRMGLSFILQRSIFSPRVITRDLRMFSCCSVDALAFCDQTSKTILYEHQCLL